MTKDDAGALEPSLYVNDALYERLMALDHLWKHPGEPPARELGDACERLIKREARLLDDGEFERWLEVFSRECIYWIPLRRGNDPRREVTVEFHDRRRRWIAWRGCAPAAPIRKYRPPAPVIF